MIKFSDEGVEVSFRTIVWIVTGLAFVGLVLAALGIRAAYQRVGFHSTAGNVITIAIVVEVSFVALVLFLGRRLAKKRGRG